MKIIGRKPEIQTLKSILNSDSAEFLAIYGRRRVGKTFLIREFFKAKNGIIFFNATGLKDGSMHEQISNFTDRLSEVFYDGVNLNPKKSWSGVFKQLDKAIANIKKNQKVVLFLDELPWMATPKSKLLQTLDYFWNQYWSHNSQIKLIICGSSASWIINKIIRNRGGLHNRLTETIQLEPFNLTETQHYLESIHISLQRHQIMLLYFVTGGVPFYLSKIRWKGSAIHIIEKLAFQKKSFLMTEFHNLFASLFKNHETHIHIVRTLAKSKTGIGKNQLLKQIGLVGGTGTNKLQELEDAGFITSFKPIFNKQRNTYYRLTDEYTLFYLKWIEPLQNQLNLNALDKGILKALQLTPEWHNWCGYAFEALCYQHLKSIRKQLELSPLDMPGTWRYVPQKGATTSGAQIDLLFDGKDDTITIVEIKCTNAPFTITKEYKENLLRKIKVFKEQTRTSKHIQICFIASRGLKEGDYAQELITKSLTLEDLFE